MKWVLLNCVQCSVLKPESILTLSLVIQIKGVNKHALLTHNSVQGLNFLFSWHTEFQRIKCNYTRGGKFDLPHDRTWSLNVILIIELFRLNVTIVNLYFPILWFLLHSVLNCIIIVTTVINIEKMKTPETRRKHS